MSFLTLSARTDSTGECQRMGKDTSPPRSFPTDKPDIKAHRDFVRSLVILVALVIALALILILIAH